jgi:hypothetical protein
MNTAHPSSRLSVGAVVIAALAGVSGSGCADKRVAPLEQRLATLEGEVAALKVQLEEAKAAKVPTQAPAPTVVPLLSMLGATLETAGYRLAEVSSEELATFRAKDGFAITKGTPAERLVVVGTAEAIGSDASNLLGGGGMNSYSVVVDVRVIDPVTKVIRASSRTSTQLLGINPAVALSIKANQAKLDAIRAELVTKLTAP